uniref:Nucleolar protein 10 n=1 Tax=Homo sapiens TaxID=9606 RepID=A0A8Q3SHY9_HUMAN
MQVSSLNEVKIYSLSCGKSLPEVYSVAQAGVQWHNHGSPQP